MLACAIEENVLAPLLVVCLHFWICACAAAACCVFAGRHRRGMELTSSDAPTAFMHTGCSATPLVSDTRLTLYRLMPVQGT